MTFDGTLPQSTSSETPDCTLSLHQRYVYGLKIPQTYVIVAFFKAVTSKISGTKEENHERKSGQHSDSGSPAVYSRSVSPYVNSCSVFLDVDSCSVSLVVLFRFS